MQGSMALCQSSCSMLRPRAVQALSNRPVSVSAPRVAPQVCCLAAPSSSSSSSPSSSSSRAASRGDRLVAQAAVAEVAVPPKNNSTPSYVSASDKYAVIEVGGVQQLVEEGRWYTCNRLEAEPGSKIQFPRVLAVKNNGKFEVGRPYLQSVKVEAEVLEELKGPKVIVFKMKPKKHYRRLNGHRQPLTKFLVTSITP